MIRAAKLDLTFDAARMAAELAALESWEPHFNPSYHRGEWSGVALRSNSPHILKLYIDETPSSPFYDTEAVAPYIRECVARIECEVRAARLMKLAAGAEIQEHRDAFVSLAHREARLHVPVVTNDATEFVVGAEIVRMLPGECWYLNVDLPHRVANRGATDRVHLVVDAVVNDWLRDAVKMAGAVH